MQKYKKISVFKLYNRNYLLSLHQFYTKIRGNCGNISTQNKKGPDKKNKKDTLMFLLIKILLYFCTKKKIQQ